MIEVLYDKGGWYWQFITEQGRTVYTSRERHQTDRAANEAAKAARQRFWANSRSVDDA